MGDEATYEITDIDQSGEGSESFIASEVDLILAAFRSLPGETAFVTLAPDGLKVRWRSFTCIVSGSLRGISLRFTDDQSNGSRERFTESVVRLLEAAVGESLGWDRADGRRGREADAATDTVISPSLDPSAAPG